MGVCPTCGEENPERFRFCPICGTELHVQKTGHLQRKMVTTLFCDIVGSTPLSEQLDAESFQQLLLRYFERSRRVIESHGGTVEKFIGDAVVSIFGVPVAHEDDALRAVRAAVGLQAGIRELNEELEQTWGRALAIRVGISSGEVFAGTHETLATGESLSTAARLQSVAQPGEILIEEKTRRLVRSSVQVTQLEPMTLKGKSSAIQVYRVLSVGSASDERHFDAPIVGRAKERALLGNEYEQVRNANACRLVTVVGAPGVGKSRLIREFVKELSGTLVLRGRCLSYGEGISYWPIVEILKAPATRLDELSLDEGVSAILSGLLGEGTATTSEEIAYAVRRVFETLADKQPLVVVFDDIQWAQSTLLDLIKYIATNSRDVGILLLCLARPELVEEHPDWAQTGAALIKLESLSESEAHELIEKLTGHLDQNLQARILTAAAGNPLFVEEMVAFIREQGVLAESATSNGQIVVPPTIQALLAARLDQLQTPERTVLEYGSIEGEIFHRGGLEMLNETGAELEPQILTLTTKELIYPDRPQITDQRAYRFRHLLIRDAAYRAIPKTARGSLHEKLANWLLANGQNLVELDELVGYHLEQSYTYRSQLASVDQSARELSISAADHLSRAGKRAADRNDVPSATNLLNRAIMLQPDDLPGRAENLLLLGSTLIETNLNESVAAFQAALENAQKTGNLDLGRKAEIGLIETGLWQGSFGNRLETLVKEVESLGDFETASWGYLVLGYQTAWTESIEKGQALFQIALDYARRSSSTVLADHILERIAWCALWGPMHTTDAIRVCDQALTEVSVSNMRITADVSVFKGVLTGLSGRLEEGRKLIADGRDQLREFGLTKLWAATAAEAAAIEVAADCPSNVEHLIMETMPTLVDSEASALVSTHLILMVQALLDQDKQDKAACYLPQLKASLDGSDPDDEASWRLMRARLSLNRNSSSALHETQTAAVLIKSSNYVPHQLSMFVTVADLYTKLGYTDNARSVLKQARELAIKKGDSLSQRRVERRLHDPVLVIGQSL